MTWEQEEPQYDGFQIETWRNQDDGTVLSVEQIPGHAPHDRGEGYQTVILPEDYHDNNDVLETLAKNVSKSEAVMVAAIRRGANDEG